MTRSERIYLSVPHMGQRELEHINEAFRTNWLSTVGPQLDAFEAAMASRLGAGVQALAVSSGTAALHLLLRHLCVGPGDRVAVSTLTFAGSVYPIQYLGAEPVFIDCQPDSANLDPSLLAAYFERAAAAGELPRVLIAVHLYGQHADLDPIVELCRTYGVTLVEDAAESLGATYRGRQTGTTADYAFLSFNGNKIITTTGGGMVLARDASALARMRKWANQAREPDVAYLHRDVGYNYRMSNVLAAIGLGQLEVLDDRVKARRAIAERYRAALADLEGVALLPEMPWGLHTRWLSVITVDPACYAVTPYDLVRHCEAANVETRPVWRPMHLQPLYAGAKVVGGPVAERLFASGLCLPSSSSLTAASQDFVITCLRTALLGSRR